LQSREQMSELHQRLHRNLWRAKRELRALWIQHPGRNGESSATVHKPAHRVFSGAFFPTLINAQGLTDEWMPAIVDCDSFKKMGIM
jgi:hypothetical protein